MNRAIRHDALLVWRETMAALAGWGDRALVVIGVMLIAVAVRHAADGASGRAIVAATFIVGGWVGFGGGQLIERRLRFHRESYFFADEVLQPSGTWRYRGCATATLAALVVGAAVSVGSAAILPSLAGMGTSFLLAIGSREVSQNQNSARPVAIARWTHIVGITCALVVVGTAIGWRNAPGWAVAVPIVVAAAVGVRIDADAARFEARAGRSVGQTLRRLVPALLWVVVLTLIAAAGGQATAAGIGLATGLAVVWFGALNVMAWRMTGRRNGDLIVLALIAAVAVTGMIAIVAVPVALALASIWLWRQSQAARWLVA